MEEMVKVLKDGANANGLHLMGDMFIGFRFVGESDYKESANKLLELLVNEHADDHKLSDTINSMKDADYEYSAWKK